MECIQERGDRWEKRRPLAGGAGYAGPLPPPAPRTVAKLNYFTIRIYPNMPRNINILTPFLLSLTFPGKRQDALFWRPGRYRSRDCPAVLDLLSLLFSMVVSFCDRPVMIFSTVSPVIPVSAVLFIPSNLP